MLVSGMPSDLQVRRLGLVGQENVDLNHGIRRRTFLKFVAVGGTRQVHFAVADADVDGEPGAIFITQRQPRRHGNLPAVGVHPQTSPHRDCRRRYPPTSDNEAANRHRDRSR